jgi:hypothetical protein
MTKDVSGDADSYEGLYEQCDDLPADMRKEICVLLLSVGFGDSHPR